MELKDKCKRHASSPLARAIRCKIQESQNIKLTEVEDSAQSTSTDSLSKPETLAKIVGDPFAAEKTWMAACTVAGSQSLAKQSSRLQSGWNFFSVGLSLLAGGLTTAMVYPLTFLIAGHICSFTTGGILDEFMNATTTPQMLGFYFGAMASIEFWLNALDTKKKSVLKTITSVAIALLSTLLILGITTGSVASAVGALLIGVIGMAILALSAKMGSQFRESLPKSVSFEKLVKASFWAILPLALMCAAAIFYAASAPPGHYSSQPYNPASPTGFAFYLWLAAWSTMVPGFLTARSTNSKSRSGCAFLSVLTQSPMLLGIAMTSIASFIGLLGLIPRDPSMVNGVIDPLSHLAAFAIILATTASGGAIGAWVSGTIASKSK